MDMPGIQTSYSCCRGSLRMRDTPMSNAVQEELLDMGVVGFSVKHRLVSMLGLHHTACARLLLALSWLWFRHGQDRLACRQLLATAACHWLGCHPRLQDMIHSSSSCVDSSSSILILCCHMTQSTHVMQQHKKTNPIPSDSDKVQV